MATITCGLCNVRCHMSLSGNVHVADLPYYGQEDRYVADAAYLCDGCGRMSVATWTTSADPNDSRWHSRSSDSGPQEYEDVRWSPPVGHEITFPGVPDQIADTATEAWTCHVVGAHRGAVMLARSVVDSTAKARAILRGTLESKIDLMADQGLIRKAVAEQAHEIRHMGNSTAHGDLGDLITPEDAAEVLNLMGEVLSEVWQAPARSNRLAEARAAKNVQRHQS